MKKQSENTQASKKEIDNCHSARRHSGIRNRKCSAKWLFLKFRENFQDNIRGNIFFLILPTKPLQEGNPSGRLLLKLFRKEILTVFFLIEKPFAGAVTQTFKKLRISL